MRNSVYIQKSQLVGIFISMLLYSIWIVRSNFSEVPKGYTITIAFPIIFAIVFFLLLWKPFTQNKTAFITVYCVMQFLRFVVLTIATLPVVQVSMNVFGRGSYSEWQYTLAGILMIYELFVTSIIINVSSAKNRRYEKRRIASLSYNELTYLLVFVVATSLVILYPSARRDLTFLVGFDTEQNAESMSVVLLLIRELFVNAKYFLLFAVIKLFVKREVPEESSELRRKSLVSFIIVLLACLVVVGLRVGTNRKRIIADAVACIVIVVSIFPKYKKLTASFFTVVGLFLVVATSVFRGATDSFSTFGGDLFSAASLQSYLCGQYNICCALETANVFGNQIGLGTLLYSAARSCFGIGTLISGMNVNTLSYYFNQIASIGYSYLRSSQIIPLVGEGAIYFTPLFAPLLSAMFVYLGVLVDRINVKSERLEIQFLTVVIGVYLGQSLSLTSNIMINNLTFKIAIFLPIVLMANKLKR